MFAVVRLAHCNRQAWTIMRGNACTNPPSTSPLPPHPPCLLSLTADPLTLPPVRAHASALSSPHRLHQRLTRSAPSTPPVCHVLPSPCPCRRRQVRSSHPLRPPQGYTNHVGRHTITNQGRRRRRSELMAEPARAERQGVRRRRADGEGKNKWAPLAWKVESADRGGRAGRSDFNLATPRPPLPRLTAPIYTVLLPPRADFP